MKNTLTLTELRNALEGRIYIYLDSKEISKAFLKNAKQEGFRFGKLKPTRRHHSNLIALEHNKQLSHVGIVGRIAFGCTEKTGEYDFHKIDYRKVLNGEEDFFYKKPEFTIDMEE